MTRSESHEDPARPARHGEAGILVSPWIDLQAFERPTGAPTPARVFAETLAQTMRRGEIRRFDRALQNIEAAATRFCASRVNGSFPRDAHGVTAMDALASGEALVVYADATAKGAFGILTPTIVSLEANVAMARALNTAQRRRLLVDHALAMLPAARGADPDAERDVVAAKLMGLASLVLANADLVALRRISDGVPAVAIAARTDRRGSSSVSTMHVVTRFPGVWLGTTTATGRA